MDGLGTVLGTIGGQLTGRVTTLGQGIGYKFQLGPLKVFKLCWIFGLMPADANLFF